MNFLMPERQIVFWDSFVYLSFIELNEEQRNEIISFIAVNKIMIAISNELIQEIVKNIETELKYKKFIEILRKLIKNGSFIPLKGYIDIFHIESSDFFNNLKEKTLEDIFVGHFKVNSDFNYAKNLSQKESELNSDLVVYEDESLALQEYLSKKYNNEKYLEEFKKEFFQDKPKESFLSMPAIHINNLLKTSDLAKKEKISKFHEVIIPYVDLFYGDGDVLEVLVASKRPKGGATVYKVAGHDVLLKSLANLSTAEVYTSILNDLKALSST